MVNPTFSTAASSCPGLAAIANGFVGGGPVEEFEHRFEKDVLLPIGRNPERCNRDPATGDHDSVEAWAITPLYRLGGEMESELQAMTESKESSP